MVEWATVLVDIVRLAAIYSMMALGFVVVYRTSRVLNLSHPGFVMLAGYAALTVAGAAGGRSMGVGTVALVIAGLVVVAAGLGAGLYTAVIRPMAGESRISIVLLTLAVLFLVEASVVAAWGGEVAFVAFPGNQVAWELAGVRLRLTDVLVVAGTVVTFAIVAALYERSAIGIRMRAVAENAGLAARRGVSIDRIGAASWALALALAVLAALMLSTQGPVSSLFVLATLKGFTVALVGGLDSIKGIAPAALLIAGAESLVVRFVDQGLGDAIPFLLLALILWFRPWGLQGTVEELDRV